MVNVIMIKTMARYSSFVIVIKMILITIQGLLTKETIYHLKNYLISVH